MVPSVDLYRRFGKKKKNVGTATHVVGRDERISDMEANRAAGAAIEPNWIAIGRGLVRAGE